MTAGAPASPDTTVDLLARLATLPDDLLEPNRADAAVLILLRSGAHGVEVLAEQRTERPSDPWSGHVGLPGGRGNPEDRSMRETVLRELREEVGILPQEIDGPPRLFDVRRARPSGLRVAVFAGRLLSTGGGTPNVDPEEVASTFWFPISALLRTEARPRSTVFGEIQVETVPYEGHVVWGFTLRLLRDFDAWLRQPATGGDARRGQLRRWRSQAL